MPQSDLSRTIVKIRISRASLAKIEQTNGAVSMNLESNIKSSMSFYVLTDRESRESREITVRLQFREWNFSFSASVHLFAQQRNTIQCFLPTGDLSEVKQFRVVSKKNIESFRMERKDRREISFREVVETKRGCIFRNRIIHYF